MMKIKKSFPPVPLPNLGGLAKVREKKGGCTAAPF
jgi:hypothetical protein